MKFKLHDIRKSKAWQQLREEGAIAERENTVRKCPEKGMTQTQIAERLEISMTEVRRLSNGDSH